MRRMTTIVFIAVAGLASTVNAQESCPMHKEHASQAAASPGVTERGDHAMGFSHEKTKHHFRLFTDGGAIEVVANGAGDTGTMESIRGHLTHITQMFSAGDFNVPMFIHDQVPPGAEVMQQRKEFIQYHLENTPNGARIRIVTTDKTALEAVHQFLRFQIEDHGTGDTTEISRT